MVKRQREKQYQSATEHRQNSQTRSAHTGVVQRTLPYNCCALTLTPYKDPVMTKEGVIFDNTALLEFLRQYHKDPLTGNALTTRDIITLHMDQDEEGRWQCPILTKPFADHSKIIAVVQDKEAYVYSYEAYHELNVKAKNWTDLTTEKKFHPKRDVVVLNDPSDPAVQARRDSSKFWHIQTARKLKNESQETSVKHSVTATRILEQLEKEKKKSDSTHTTKFSLASSSSNKKLKIFSEDVTGVQYTSGKTAGSLTSTAMATSGGAESREASEEEILKAQLDVMKRRQEKGYVRLTTNLGDLLLELHCEIAPRTCANFLGLCRTQAYDNTKFHRLIPKFMIQGGGEDNKTSFWGPAFQDEFDKRLKHDQAGILSMANSGSHTNLRQFFMTFGPCPHLDGKHSVFGQVVDGMAVLTKMQEHVTDKKDRPQPSIQILSTEIIVDPAQEAADSEMQRYEALAQKRQARADKKQAKRDAVKFKDVASSTQIGKYLSKSALANGGDAAASTKADIDLGLAAVLPGPKKKASSSAKTTKFGNFSGWK